MSFLSVDFTLRSRLAADLASVHAEIVRVDWVLSPCPAGSGTPSS